MALSDYKLVKLVSGVHSVHALDRGETFHPVIGPAAEAEALYVRQLRLPERMARHQHQHQHQDQDHGTFVVWDVGLGAAANVLTVLRACRSLGIFGSLRILSFDLTLDPLRFALGHAAELGYFHGFEEPLRGLLDDHRVTFQNGDQAVSWEYEEGDFPRRIGQPAAATWPQPHAILFDAYSPARNPEMWTLPLFTRVHALLDPGRPCAMPTYSRSTLLRVTLLLAGFYVGTGHATGEKEETTIAANTLDLIEEPLDAGWLRRARNSTSAEPMREPLYRQARLTDDSWERLRRHPQFG